MLGKRDLLTVILPCLLAACADAAIDHATGRKKTNRDTSANDVEGTPKAKPKPDPILFFSYDGAATVQAHIKANAAEGGSLRFAVFAPAPGENRAIDCASLPQILSPVEGSGAAVIANLPVAPSFLSGLDAAARTTLQACLLDAQGQLVTSVSTSVMNAWDRDANVAAASPRVFHGVQAYAEACDDELGENPMFEGGKAFDCIGDPSMTVVPITATDMMGNVTTITNQWPLSAAQQQATERCDRPAWLDYNGGSPCAPFTRIGRFVNAKGTRFVAVCRRYEVAAPDDAGFTVVGVIGHNPDSGKTCWFNNRGDAGLNDGRHIPPPTSDGADAWYMDSPGIRDQGCPQCHDSDPWAHSPWVDQALDSQGKTIVPMFGQDSAYTLATKYSSFAAESFIGTDAASQANWQQPRFLTNVGACGSCHRIGAAFTTRVWAPRSVGTPENFQDDFMTDAFRSFARLHWMPTTAVTEAQWASSPSGQSANAIIDCAIRGGCQVADVPH